MSSDKTDCTNAPQSSKILWVIISIFFLILLLPTINAVPPFQSQSDTVGLIVESAYPSTHVQSTDLNVHAHIYNASSGTIIPTSLLSCYSHAYSHKDGSYHILSNLTLASYGVGFNTTIPSFYFDEVGEYSVIIWCNSSDVGGFLEYTFEVTPNGELITEGKAIFYTAILFLLIVFLAMALFGFITFDNLLSRVGLFGLSYLLLIAITFISWNMANDFLPSAPFLVSMLRILFFVLIYGAFPLLVGSFAWYVLMVLRIKEIDNLMNKGIGFDEAQQRVRRRK